MKRSGHYTEPRPCCERPDPFDNCGRWSLGPLFRNAVCVRCGAIVVVCQSRYVGIVTGEGLVALADSHLRWQYEELTADQRCIRRSILEGAMHPNAVKGFRLREKVLAN